MTPSDWLRRYADLAEEYPLTTMTEAAQDLQAAMLRYMRDVADQPGDEAIFDLFLVAARCFFAIHLAARGGSADRPTLNAEILEFGRAVGRELSAHDTAKRKETH